MSQPADVAEGALRSESPEPLVVNQGVGAQTLLVWAHTATHDRPYRLTYDPKLIG